MNRVSVFVLAALLGVAPVALADSIHSGGGDVTATGGAGGAGGRSESTAVGVGGDASNRTTVDTDVRNSASSGSVSGASSKQSQGQVQGQGQDQGINAFNGNTTVVNPDVHVNYDGRTHAESAARPTGWSGANQTPCGDVAGATVQTGIFGGGFTTTSAACKAYRSQLLQREFPGTFQTRVAVFTQEVSSVVLFPVHLVMSVFN